MDGDGQLHIRRPDGSQPYAELDSAGKRYGITREGGVNGVNTVYDLTFVKRWLVGECTSWFLKDRPRLPWAGVVFDPVGNLQGISIWGVGNGVGRVFEIG